MGDAPSLVVRGQHDDLPPRSDHVRLVDAITGARLTEYPDCSHAVLRERADRVTADVPHFVAALPTNPAGPR